MDSSTNRKDSLLRRIRWLVGLFMAGLVVSGATAIPVETEVDWLIQWLGIDPTAGGQVQSGMAGWLLR